MSVDPAPGGVKRRLVEQVFMADGVVVVRRDAGHPGRPRLMS